MNTSKTLLAILVKELPKRGGWPADASRIVQDGDGEAKSVATCADVEFPNVVGIWYRSGGNTAAIGILPLADDWQVAIITREQYEAALAAQAPVANADGWIDWAGGECPLENGTIIDTKDSYGKTNFGEIIGTTNNVDNIFWQRGVCSYPGYEIIAYRLHQPQDANSRANDNRLETDLNECIGQPQEDTTLLMHFLLDEINDADVNMRLDDAYELAQHLISVGYRKQ